MRVPISWLKDYVDVTLSVPTVEALAEKLTLAGLEVEHIEYVGLPNSGLAWDPDKLFVGQVLAVERHPNADRLLLATVAYGPPQPITVVTGAPNLKPGDSGQKVVLALKGARLYDGHKEGKVITTLKEATLRGIKNDSMVCSEKELGISDEQDGILILPDSAPTGTPLVDYLGDAVLDIAVLPNTARTASIIGVAREVAALTGQTVRCPTLEYAASGPPIEQALKIEITDATLNPRFTAGIIKGITLGPSPYWLKRRLQLCGIRAISNVVDVSNYVMLETGQPTHAYDLKSVRMGTSGTRTLITRLARPGEKFTTLDNQVRELGPADILVCDEAGLLGLAGVMGGADSEVKDGTTDILFEAAAWDQISIRRTARKFSLNSEASARFARGIHPALALMAQKRGLYLLQQLCGGVIDTGILDAYPKPAKVVTIELHPEHVSKLLGLEIPTDEMTRILRALEFTVQPAGEVSQAPSASQGSPAPLVVSAPAHRLDIEGEHDLIEEVVRIYGYDKLPSTLMADTLPNATGNPEIDFEERVKDVLVEAGLQEIVSYRLTTPEAEMRAYAPGTPADDKPYVRLLNPLTPERAAMRHTLLPGVLETTQNNLRHHARVALFELGTVYLPSEGDASGAAGAALPDELPRLSIAMSGARHTLSWHLKEPGKDAGKEDGKDAGATGPNRGALDFFDLKGVIETLLGALAAGGVTFEATAHPSFYPGRTAAIVANGTQIGLFGEIDPRVRDAWAFEGDAPVLLADIDLEALRTHHARASAGARIMAEVPRFPATVEDLSIIVNDDVKASDVEQALRRTGGSLVRGVTLFDVYRGGSIPAGKKSLTYSLTYQADDRTLIEKDVEKLRAKLIRAVEGNLGATVRQ